MKTVSKDGRILVCPVTRVKKDVVKRIPQQNGIEARGAFTVPLASYPFIGCIYKENNTLFSGNDESYVMYKSPFRREENVLKRLDYFLKINGKIKEIPEYYPYIGSYFEEHIPDWLINNKKAIVYLLCGTGSGKTYFIECLAKMNFQILYIANRSLIIGQVENELKRYKNVKVITYQSLSINDRYNVEFLNNYRFVVCDECHSLIADTTYDPFLNVAYRKIIRSNNTTRLFLSATGNDFILKSSNDISEILNNDPEFISRFYLYESTLSNVHINKIKTFCHFNELVEVIQNSDYKWIIFVRSKTQGEKIAKTISEQTTKTFHFLNREGIDKGDTQMINIFDKIAKQSKFDVDILITTKLLDCGVNIKDEKVKGVVIFDKNEITFMQELGRKRSIDSCDEITVYVSDDSITVLEGMKSQMNVTLKDFRETKEMIERDSLPACLIKNGKRNDVYRNAVYKDYFSKLLKYNFIGEQEIRKNIDTISSMINDKNATKIPIEWIENRLHKTYDVKPVVNKVQQYLEQISHLIGKKIDEDESKDVRLLLTQKYIKIYGYDSKNDRPTVAFSLKKLNEKYVKNYIPIYLKQLKVGPSTRLKNNGFEVIYLKKVVYKTDLI